MHEVLLPSQIFVRNVRRLLTARDMSMRELARRLNVTVQAVSQWFNVEKNAPRQHRWVEICELFGVTIPQMLDPDFDPDSGALALSPVVRRAIALRRTISPDAAVAAQALGITLAELEEEEAGKALPSREYLFRLCERTDSRPSFLRSGDVNAVGVTSLILMTQDPLARHWGLVSTVVGLELQAATTVARRAGMASGTS